jgi:hypothetical protein
MRIVAAKPSQTNCVRSLGITFADTLNREWSSIPVSALAVVPSASRKPWTTSICQSSIAEARSQRFQFPGADAGARVR